MKKTVICGLVAALCASAALPATAADGAKISDGVVRIGVLTDMSGVYAQVGGKGSVIAAQMAVDEVGGKVLGMPVEIVSADHQNKVDIATATARQWIDTQKVDMITELLNSGVGIAVQKLASEKKRITINTGAGSTALTNKECTPYGIHYAYDVFALAKGVAAEVIKDGGKDWTFITADYAFGQSLEANARAQIEKNGGTVKGSVKHPLNTADFSSYLLQAQATGAHVIALANAGGDFTNAVKQAKEFGVVGGGRSLVGLLIFITDIKALGLDAAQGLKFTEGYYWDYDAQTRKFGEAFMKRAGSMPTMSQAGVYSAVKNYLKAVEKAGTDDADAVRAVLGEMTINDEVIRNGKLRADGRLVHDMYLAQVKEPKASKGAWDLEQILRVIPGEQAYQPLAESTCTLVKK
ncbi:ABC transporter substrate-binding protein [Niveibacterium umoris]|uniref:Branched-chain amino acid transport system substrate-binding protein n=1 Tax=Niveibacterium umoris TaxID=1193620 RepID=A0A840BM32_9RHOO|nr:ABC transporter substrate-binding protein [Niveibacterium umoris]MBB4013544.1 branched-chain amino acid transport system substrate-binding protein [Niveibacterium umoris]